MTRYFLVCLALLAGSAGAQTNQRPAASPVAPATGLKSPPAGGPRVTIAATEMPLTRMMQMLSEQSGHRILIGPETSGRLTLKLNDMPLVVVLNVAARVSDNRWSRLTVPAETAKTLTPEQALALVTAAQTLASSAVSVQTGDGPAVSVGAAPAGVPQTSASPEARTDAVTVYLFHTKADVAAIRAAREASQKAEGDKPAETPAPAVAATMSEDARADPKVVGAYSALQMLSPNQVAILTREFLLHSTPEQRQSIGEAFAQQRDKMRDAMRQPGEQ